VNLYCYKAVVRSVYDGDTIRADIDLGFEVWLKNVALRVQGIDCPELKTQEGKNARLYARELLPAGAEIVIRSHKGRKEKYGRYLVQIELADGTSYESALLAAGHAVPYFGGARD
jgi:micrococcal nuclease